MFSSFEQAREGKRYGEKASRLINRLRARQQMVSIYREEREAVSENIKIWRRIQARRKIIEEVKQEKKRYLRLYHSYGG